ncbi:MAG: tRNA 2-thiouridine(34) synthase MnmA [Desulfotomaculaceae bacterium]|nr:tRNA 2-thiouridine(34) synthase MnmA [Desulfotomaculaceae bacterium]
MAKTSVIVAMSGGVDSSVTAALLLEQGYDVTAVTMRLWDAMLPGAEGKCDDCCEWMVVEDARRVAGCLGIPYYVIDFRCVFEKKVIDYFIGEYLCGRTPNPCTVCNRYVKFGALLDWALAFGAEYIATGHYARLGFSGEYGRYTVRRAVDGRKDQTYALYGLTQRQIARTLMPLGEFTKEQVRSIAADLDIPVAGKAESQEICFIQDDNYREFLREKTGDVRPGVFLNLEGNVIGEHRGIPFYTVGQRKGLGIATGERLYVIKIDPERNAITLGPEEATLGSGLIAGDVNLILYDRLDGPVEVEAQVRYKGRPAPATLTPLPGGRLKVDFHMPQRSITPGQAVAFYQGDYLVGGATIESAGITME